MIRYVILFCLPLTVVYGHGRLMDPPSRNSMWRFGFSNPINYNDNEVYCGGFGLHYNEKNKGRCGVCGDVWEQEEPREHEAGGKYGNGIIGARYVMGQEIEVEVDLTTNHWGYFDLKLCPVNSKNEVATQECMDKHPLYLVDDPSTYHYKIPSHVGKSATLTYKVMLPKGVTCNQCVIQWTYKTGNTWEVCNNGTGAIGCGDQETFRNCADIQIYTNTVGRPPMPDGYVEVKSKNPVGMEDKASSDDLMEPHVVVYGLDDEDRLLPKRRERPVVRAQVCKPTNLYRQIPEMKEWCKVNCLKYPSNCDPVKCTCIDECEGIGKLAGITGTDIYCQKKCLRNPYDECPKDCRCYAKRWNEEVTNTVDFN